MARRRARAFTAAAPRGARRGRGRAGVPRALTGAGSRMPAQLQEAYIAGKVAPRIRWGTGGDFKRCVAQARKHGMGRKAEGACANLHRSATGFYPGRGRKH